MNNATIDRVPFQPIGKFQLDNGDLARIPWVIKCKVLTYLDLKDLAAVCLLSKYYNYLAAKDEVWEAVAARIHSWLNKDPRHPPFYRQVVGVIRNLKTQFGFFQTLAQLFNGPRTILLPLEIGLTRGLDEQFAQPSSTKKAKTEQLPPGPVRRVSGAPSLYSLDKLQELLKARDVVLIWDALARASVGQNPDAHIQGPELDALNSSQAILEEANKFSAWFNEHFDTLNQLTGLDLSKIWVSSYPEELSRLTNLNEISFSGNPGNLEQVRAEIDEMFNQQSMLNLSMNDMRVLRGEIGRFRQLRVLDLSGNQLQMLPVEVGQLGQLRECDLSDNHFAQFPVILTTLPRLHRLWLSNNILQELPKEVGNLTGLVLLDLSDNDFEQFPSVVLRLHNLHSLFFTRNGLTQLPEEIGALRKLEVLELGDNGLTELPQRISELVHLRTINLSDNALDDVPEELVGLIEERWLKNVDLSGNPLANMPLIIRHLFNACLLKRTW